MNTILAIFCLAILPLDKPKERDIEVVHNVWNDAFSSDYLEILCFQNGELSEKSTMYSLIADEDVELHLVKEGIFPKWRNIYFPRDWKNPKDRTLLSSYGHKQKIRDLMPWEW